MRHVNQCGGFGVLTQAQPGGVSTVDVIAEPFFFWVISSLHSFGVVIRGAAQPVLMVEVVQECADTQNQTLGIEKSSGFPFSQRGSSVCLR